MNVERYYDTKAADYDSGRAKGFLRWFVLAEKKALMENLSVKNGETIFDVGCGQGFYSHQIRNKKGKPFGIDISPKMIKEYKKQGFKGEVIDIQKKHINKKFDKMLCAGALEFIPDPDEALHNMAKSLNKGKIFVLLCPPLSPVGLLYKTYHLTHGINIHLFSRSKIKSLLEKNGFKILKIERPHSFAMVVKSVRV